MVIASPPESLSFAARRSRRVLHEAVCHVQVPVGHRNVHRLAEHTTAHLHRRCQVGDPGEVVGIGEGRTSALTLEIEHEGCALGRREDAVGVTESDPSVEIAADHRVGAGGFRDQVAQQLTIDAHSMMVDRHASAGPDVAPQGECLVVAELDAGCLEQVHGDEPGRDSPATVMLGRLSTVTPTRISRRSATARRSQTVAESGRDRGPGRPRTNHR